MISSILLFYIFNSFGVFSQEVIYYPSKEVESVYNYKPLKFDFTHTNNNETSNCIDFKNKFISPRKIVKRQAADSTFYGNPKTREEKWHLAFFGQKTAFDQIPSLINLLHMLASKHLNNCAPIILYDKFVENSDDLLLAQLMKTFPHAYVHGKISSTDSISEFNILKTLKDSCVSYILFMADVMKSGDVLGLQANSKVVVVARSSQWRVQEFLYHKASRNIVNLLVIAQSFRDDNALETPYILYTHNLFIDGLGSSNPEVLTSWARGKLARPQVNLFPPKMSKGYAGHRFSVVAADQPPFVFKRVVTDQLGNKRTNWEGIEYRILNLLGHRNNFSIEIKEPTDLSQGSGDAVSKEIAAGHGDMGIAGMYTTVDRFSNTDMTFCHSQDCAVFISLTSTALPKYRAIMGPFHWTVWLALTFTYLFGIFPLAFSDKHSLKHLVHNSGEVENMFWYVFGTFTNCFTFIGKNSWSRTTKITTRLLIGWYWIFTIIITACYTGSIIAFVTLPVYPETVDSVKQLLAGNYRVGTLEIVNAIHINVTNSDKGGWEKWFANSSDKYTTKLLKHLELVPTIEAGLLNTTRAFFWSYAFLGSKYQLEYVVQNNFTYESSKRAILHISNECFAPFGVSIALPKESVYMDKLNKGILSMLQSGIISKIENDVKWDMQRSSSGKLLQVSSGGSLRIMSVDERGLSLSDTQGMFLLLGAGFLVAGVALLSEWLGGCGRMCRRFRNRALSIVSTISTDSSASEIAATPASREKSEYGDMYNDSSTDVKQSIIKNNVDSVNDNVDNQSINTGKEEENPKETFKIHIDECSDDIESSNNSDIVVHGQGLLVSADIIHTSSENEQYQGHCRRPSFIDWDREITQLFHYPKPEVGSEDEQEQIEECNDENDLADYDMHVCEKIDEERTNEIFGEKILLDVEEEDLENKTLSSMEAKKEIMIITVENID